MAIAKASRASLSFARESTYGVAPAANTFKALRRLSASLSVKPVTAQSGEVRADRQRTKPIVVGKQTGGDTAHELMPVGYDQLLEGAFGNAMFATPSVTVTAVAAGTGVYTVTSGGTGMFVGSLVEIDGLANDINTSYPMSGANKAFKVSASTGTSVTVDNTSSVAAATQTGTMKVVGMELAAGDLAITLVSGNITFTLTTGSWSSANLAAGEWVYVGGIAAANQLAGANAALHMGWYRVKSVTAKVLTFDICPAGANGASVNSTGVQVRIYFGDFLVNGTTFYSYAIERSFNDIAVYELFTGLAVNTMSVELSEKAIARASFGFVGKDGTASNSQYAATPAAATVQPPFSTAGNLNAISINNVQVAQSISTDALRALSFGIDNGIDELPALGTASGVIGLNQGDFSVDGRLTAYFADLTLYNLLFNNTDTQIAVGMRNSRGGAQVWDIPQMTFTDGTPQLSQGSQPVTMDMSFSASVDDLLGYTASVSQLRCVGY